MSKARASRTNETSPRAAELEDVLKHLHAAIDGIGRLLRERVPEVPACSHREVMKPSEYADHLRVGVGKVHGWVEQGMPHFKVEGRIRIAVSEADAWVKSRQTVDAESEGEE